MSTVSVIAQLGSGIICLRKPPACDYRMHARICPERFPANITKCLRIAFFMEHARWLLLKKIEEFQS